MSDCLCLNSKSGKALADRIAKETGVKLHDCYQCGKCTAGCPMAHAMDLMPRQIVRYMQLGQMDEVLNSKTIWLCASCHTCVERCPHSINLPALIEKARHEAKRQKICAAREVDIFTDVFIENVKLFGRSQEVILAGAYNVLSKNFVQDMVNVPHMIRHQLVKPELNLTKDRAKVSEIIKKSMREEEKR